MQPKFNSATSSIPPSLKDWAFQEIKEAILADQLKPGQIYTDLDMAQELGTSKTPVREALIDLTTRGFFELIPRKGFQLKVLTRGDIKNLLDFRRILEVAVIRIITPTITDEDIKALEAFSVKEIDVAEAKDWRGLLDVDREFHLFLASLTNNPYLVSSLENVRDFIVWVNSKILVARISHSSHTDMPERRLGEIYNEWRLPHAEIVEKLKARDADGAIGKMEEHFRNTEKWLLHEVPETLIGG